MDRQRAIGISIDDWVIFDDSSSDDDNDDNDDEPEAEGKGKLGAEHTGPHSAAASLQACPHCGHGL